MLLKTLTLLLHLHLAVSKRSAGCGQNLPHGVHAGQSKDFIIEVDDPVLGKVNREYRLHVPWRYDINTEISMVIDYHGWTGNSHGQERDSQFINVADEDEIGFLVVTPNGMSDAGANMGSFNCSRTDGPLGPPCDTDRARWGEITCYESCPFCDSSNSCDWTSCHDDIAFTRAMVESVESQFCVDMNSIHMSGVSNGGMFSYYAASLLSDILASIAPVAGAPLIGFGDVPTNAVNLIDFHGINDDTIPYDFAHAEGTGPHNSVISWDGYYYEPKHHTIGKWTNQKGCNAESRPYHTSMDGVTEFTCEHWLGCNGGTEVVACTANHGHDYPFGGVHQYIEGTRILWHFMKNHPRQP